MSVFRRPLVTSLTSARLFHSLRNPIVLTNVGSVNIYQPQPAKSAVDYQCQFPKFCSTFPQYSEVNYEQLVEILKNKKATVIDVRNPEELQDLGSIPGAVNIPLKTLKDTLEKEDIPKNRPLVFSCMAGVRSKKAVVVASNLGYRNLLDYGGGWQDWAANQKS